jgi:Carboxypeptidase regulatory-like domain
MTGTIRRLGVVGVICAVTLFCSTAIAQESRGSIAGLVVDSSGGALPGVTVTVVNNGTNSRTALVTNDTGQYAALFLLPGTYHVTAELSGFQTKDHPNVQVRVGERSQLDMTLQPAGVTEQVLVACIA